MRTVIIEDEKAAARRLDRMVTIRGLEVITMLHSVEDAIDWFQNNEQPDLIFLDIQLSDGLSFEIFEEVEVTSAIIFTTAYDEFALKAFKLNSVDYLLKPIDEDELTDAINKFKSRTQEVQLNIKDIQSLLVSSSTTKKYKQRFTIKVGQHLKIIPTESIACLYSENKATYIHTSENRSYLIDTSLEYCLDELNPEHFFRVNRTFIVRVNAIKDIIAYTNSRLKIMLNGFDEQEIIVSRDRVKEFKNWIS